MMFSRLTHKAVLLPVLLFSTSLGSLSHAHADSTLWYNGDFDGSNGLVNEIDAIIPEARVFDDFDVTDNWRISSIFTHNVMDFDGVTQAKWTIRTGVSAGNGGTLVASGASTATQTPTGQNVFSLPEYIITVSGLSVDLTPGKYWLQVTPVGREELGSSYSLITSGANSIGTPAGNNGNAFYTNSDMRVYFGNTDDRFGGNTDFSLGLTGHIIEASEVSSNLAYQKGEGEITAVPEPSLYHISAAVVLSGVGLLRRRRKQAA